LKQTEIGAVLALVVSEEELVNRLKNRGLTSGRSDDSNQEVIRERIAEYHKKTSAVADYYRKFNKVTNIPGEGTVDEIFESLCTEIDKRL
jgi:adenylate kinase